MSLISIIIPNYNHAEFLEQRIESILNQTFQDFELILLDDCSTDSSRIILEKYKNHPKISQLVYNTSNSGSTFIQWNKGVDLAKSEWINIAESDDYSDAGFLKKLTEIIHKDAGIVLAYCQSNKVDEKGNNHGNWSTQTQHLSSQKFGADFIMDGNDFIYNFLIKENYIPNASAVIFRKSAYVSAGKARADIAKCGDWYIWIKILFLGKVGFVAESLNNFRFHDNSVIAKASKIKSVYTKFYYDGIFRKQLKEDLKNSPEAEIYNKNNTLYNHLKYNEVTYFIEAGFYIPALKKILLLLFTNIGFWAHTPYILKVLYKSVFSSGFTKR